MKCLNCGNLITDGFTMCSEKCAKEYFNYINGEDLKSHFEFSSEYQIGSDGSYPINEIEKRCKNCQSGYCKKHKNKNLICNGCYNKDVCGHITIIGLTITKKDE